MVVAPATKRYDSCGANNRAGNPCGRPAGWGTDHAGVGTCKLHGGSTRNGAKHAARLSARAQLEALTREPLTPDQYIDPIGALLSAVTEAAMVVAYLREQVMELPEWRGDVMALTKEGYPIPVSEEARALVRLYGEWHDRQVKAAKACAAAKIDERVTQLAERQGAMLDAAFRLYMERMGYDAERMAEGRKVFAGAFRELQPKLVGSS